MTKLIFTDKNYSGQVYELSREKTTVGRGDQNNLVIRESSLSTVHCEIRVNGSEVIVRDLGSRNGTFINGVQLTNQQSQLKSGQAVRFGSVEARLELESPAKDHGDSEITAVHAMSRIMRDQRRELQKPKPEEAPVKLKPVVDLDLAEGHTVFLTRTPQRKEHPAAAAPEPSEVLPARTSRKATLVIAAVLVLGLIVLLWMRWRPGG